MPVTEKQKRYLEKKLDEYDEALVDKPELAKIYDSEWRRKYREKSIAGGCLILNAYSAPFFGLPSRYQCMLEEGAKILLSKLASKKEKNHLIKRLRDGIPSAEEELLLARGFAIEFGIDSIAGPSDKVNIKRPEFFVNVMGHSIGIEAVGLFDANEVYILEKISHIIGVKIEDINYTTDVDMKRVEHIINKKISHGIVTDSRIIIFSQYALVRPAFDEVTDFIQHMILESKEDRPLAIAYIYSRSIQGVWFNDLAMKRMKIKTDLCKRIRRAIINSFCLQKPGLNLTEKSESSMS